MLDVLTFMVWGIFGLALMLSGYLTMQIYSRDGFR